MYNAFQDSSYHLAKHLLLIIGLVVLKESEVIVLSNPLPLAIHYNYYYFFFGCHFVAIGK